MKSCKYRERVITLSRNGAFTTWSSPTLALFEVLSHNIDNVDLLFLTEIWLTPKVSDATICLSDYNIIRKDWLSRVEVLLYFSKIIQIKSNVSSISNINFEYLSIHVVFKILKLRFSCIYLPPIFAKCTSSVVDVINLIRNLFPNNCSFYILGDFNLPHIK